MIPDAVVVSASIFFLSRLFFQAQGGSVLLSAALFVYMPAMVIGFLIYFMFISAPLASYAKSRIAGIKYSGIVKSIAAGVSVLQPLGYALFLFGAIWAFHYNEIIPVAISILGILFYFVSISQSLMPNFLVDTKGNRSNAISHGWLLLSGKTPRLVYSDLLVFSPVIILILLFLISNDVYALASAAFAFVFCSGIWYGTVASIHDAVLKGSDTYNVY
jgi:hypothetical protein